MVQLIRNKGVLAKMFLKRFRLKGLGKESTELMRVTEEGLKTRSASGAAVLDVRFGTEFAEGHFPGSLNVGLGGRTFVACAELFVAKQREILLVVNKPEDANRAQAELAGSGFEKVLGFIEASDLTVLHQLTELSVHDLNSTLLRGGKPAILDVRSPGEWKSSGIFASRNIPLVNLAARITELSFSNPLVVVCQDGYQSAVASSWLQANGFDSIQHLIGGMDAYTSTPLRESTEVFSFCSLQPGPTA